MRLSPGHGIGFVLFVLIISTARAEAQQKLTPVNYGTITISALHWPYLIIGAAGENRGDRGNTTHSEVIYG